MMRIIVGIVMLGVALFGGPAAATNYYVSTTGSDSNAGTLASPFLTIQKAATIATAGSNVYVRGGTYRETVTMAKSGSALSPISFQPYNNEQVTVTGLNTVSGGWSTYSGSTYQNTTPTYQNTTVGATSQLFVNGNMMIEARSTNSGYLNPLRRTYNTVGTVSIQSPSTGPSTISSSSLNNPSDGTWNGAKMAVLGGYGWVTNTESITSQTGNTVSFGTHFSNNCAYEPTAGNKFYLYGSTAAVDSAKEYYYDGTAQKLYLNSAVNPNTQTVEVRKRELGFDLGSQSYISVSGFRFKAANVNVAGNHNTINNCQILYPTPFNDDGHWTRNGGVTISGNNNTVSNSEIGYSWTSGLTVSGSSNTVSNNVVHDVNWFGSDSSAIDISGWNNDTATSNNTVTQNTMYNTGRSGLVHRYATGAAITHNDISRYGALTSDLGGTYCYETDGSGTSLAYNKIHDTRSFGACGVYMDGGSSNFSIHHNVFSQGSNGAGSIGAGVVLNYPANINMNVYNNTAWNVVNSGVCVGNNSQNTNVNMYNNLSNGSISGGTSMGTNITTTTDKFTNSAAGDFTLKSTSSAINAGTVIPGITDGSIGTPDVGAYEYGAAAWTAGASFKTWLAGNQVAATLSDAASVTSGGVRTTAGSLVAGRTGAESSTNNRAFLKFALPRITGQISSAVLRLYENTAPTDASGGVSLYTVNSTWTSGSVAYGQGVTATGTSFYDPANLDLYTDIDVTSIVQGWINNPSTNYGFSLRNDSEMTSDLAKYFDGLYGVTAPQLIITAPEPSVLAMLASLSVVGVGVLAWRKRKWLSETMRRRVLRNETMAS